MALASTLARDGMRPASFVPSIKCSSCGEEIEIAAMGDHICGNAPPSPKAQPASLSNPFTLRQMNAHGHLPHAPSPLQKESQSAPPPQTRIRAPTVSSKQIPAPKPVRPPPPQINPDAANMFFLAPRPPRAESPMSPAVSVRSGSSNSSRPPALKSMTSPMPRFFDPRPPSPELSANLDCAFPPFPAPLSSAGSGSRPGTANGRRTPTPSGRAPSRGSTRQDSKIASEGNPFSFDTRSPMSDGPNPFDERRRPSQPGSLPPLDRRRPSLSSLKLSHEPPPIPTEPIPRPSTSHTNRSQIPGPSTAAPNQPAMERQPMQKKGAPRRPERPEEEVLSPRFLDQLSAEPVVEMPSTFSPSQPPVPARSAERSQTFPVRNESSDEPAQYQALHNSPSVPQMRGRERRPTLTASSRSEPSQIPQAANRARSQSRSGPRMDHRLQDAPPVPRPVQQHKQEKSHSPSGSGSSTASSASMGNSNSSSGPSPIGSAASSIDAFSPLSHEGSQYGEDEGMRVAGLNFKAAQKPGMRAEQLAQRSPPRNFARPSPPKHIAMHERVPDLPNIASPPMESPMDPMLQSVQGARVVEPWQPAVGPQRRPTLSRTQTGPELGQRGRSADPVPPMPPLSVPKPSGDDYDPYRPISPQPATRARSKSSASQFRTPLPGSRVPAMPVPPLPQEAAHFNTPQPQFKAFNPAAAARPQSPPQRAPTASPPLQATPRAQPQFRPYNPGTAVRPMTPQAVAVPPPPAIPQEAPRGPMPTRRRTSAKPMCRGCGLMIEGKSVKAADGRLTGRWHKTCFTCQTCEQPFTTADFYVISNHPYCEQHYHEKNGSLCHGCHRGIEGQYLETTSSSINGSVEKKFHPRCFTCHDCRQVLSDDYFEITGKVYCERHALAAMRGQARMTGAGSGLNPPDRRALTAERRTTKLMMM